MQRNQRYRAPGAGKSSMLLGMMASTAAALCGCSAGENMIATMGLPSSQAPAQPGTESTLAQQGDDGAGEQQDERLTVTPQQRGYLDALAEAGVRPSSDLLALSIGSYVCQARAAKQNEQAVWDFVVPLVRNDVIDAHIRHVGPKSGEVDAATANYISIATARLC